MTLLLHIRWKQFIRMLQSVGWVLILIALPLFSIFILSLLHSLKDQSAIITSFVLLLFMSFIHFQRKDRAFLQRLDHSVFWVFFWEYQFLMLPFSLSFAYALGFWMIPLYCHLGIIFLALIPPIKSLNKSIGVRNFDWIPIHSFEWRIGIRRYGLALSFFYFPGIFLSYFILFPLISILLTSYLITSFFEDVEPKELIVPFLPVNRLIKNKVWNNTKLILFVFTPQIVLFLIFHFQRWYLLLAVLLFSFLLINISLFHKYSLYLPGRSRSYNQLTIGLFSVGMLVLFFLPVSFIYWFLKASRAQKRLTYFFGHSDTQKP